MSQGGVVVVGGGVMGAAAAYYLTQRGRQVTLLDQFDIPNHWAASGDHLRVFRLAYGTDVFYTEMAAKAMALWQELNAVTGEKLLVQNGVLQLAAVTHGEEEASFATLRELKIPVVKMSKDEIRRNYPMINTRAIKYAIFHKDGGMLWAQRATAALASLAQRHGAKLRAQTRIVGLVKDKKRGIRAVKDASGKTWEGEAFLFAGGAWTNELLKSYRIPIQATRQFQLYLRPPANRGRYRPEHFPVFAAMSQGFYGFPLHIHGFMKIGDHRRGPVGKPGPAGPAEITPAFEKKCRSFLKRFIPELAGFTEFEGSVCYYDNTKDEDFILDRLPDAPNGYVAAGFSGHGFKFAPLIGKTMAELMTAGKAELNLHRFRLSRFKSRS